MWDASATLIDVPLENAINMRSVWVAWFQFWGKQHLLHIDVLFFRNILNVLNRIKGVQLHWQKKSIKIHVIYVGHVKFKWRVLNVYFKFYEYSLFLFFLTAQYLVVEWQSYRAPVEILNIGVILLHWVALCFITYHWKTMCHYIHSLMNVLFLPGTCQIPHWLPVLSPCLQIPHQDVASQHIWG